MHQVTRILVGDAQRHRVRRRREVDRGQELRDIFDQVLERAGAFGVAGIVGQEVAVLLER